jgi:hypothetical protein
VLLLASFAGCSSGGSLDDGLNRVTDGYRFNLTAWEVGTFSTDLTGMLTPGIKAQEDDIPAVLEYFSLAERIGTLETEIELTEAGIYQQDPAPLQAELESIREQSQVLEDRVEVILERQIREMLSEMGIYNPLDSVLSLQIGFPPMNFALEKPPQLLVISPRDSIESTRTIMLRSDITLDEAEAIEDAAAELGVSALVVHLGGIATYPSFVDNSSSLRFALDTAAEEWLHQYLTFRPLGFIYALDIAGVSQNYSVSVMNETLASMTAKEIGQAVYDKYYAAYEAPVAASTATASDAPAFDFNAAMRNLRLTVDDMLSRGMVEQAEAYMEQQQQYILDNGYYIRKLNQAYFAFYGSYADSPGSVDPIGEQMRELRSKSASLADFFKQVSTMTSPDQLAESLG